MKWVESKLGAKIVKNVSLGHLVTLFGSKKIDISSFDLVIVGKRNGVRQMEYFKIIGCLGILFYGCHKILWKNNEVDVASLTSLRRSFMNFNDQISFERSTFLILPENEELIRIKSIRFMLTCPKFYCMVAWKTPEICITAKNEYKRIVLKKEEFMIKTIDLLIAQQAGINDCTAEVAIHQLFETINTHLQDLLFQIYLHDAQESIVHQTMETLLEYICDFDSD